MKRWIVTNKTIDMEAMETVSENGYWYDGPVDRCDPATATLIATLIASAVSVGATGYSLANQPGQPKPTVTPPQGTTAQQQAGARATQAAVAQQLPNQQASASGFTNPAYQSMMAQLGAGTTGTPGAATGANRAVAQAFGFPATPSNFNLAGSTTNTSVPPSETALSDFTNQFFRG